MEVTVRHAKSWSEFEPIWIESMHHQEWVLNPNPIDYQMQDELDELENEFDNDNHVYLIAETTDGRTGLLEFRYRESFAKNGIMMPGVPLHSRGYGVAEALLAYQERFLRQRGIPLVGGTLKYHRREGTRWYFDILKQSGFDDLEPEGYQMFVHLDEFKMTDSRKDTKLKRRDDFTLNDFTEFCIRAYATTDEDRAIHGYDRYVSDPKFISEAHRRMLDGHLGQSPSEWWIVAMRGEEPVGYIIGFASRDPSKKHGIIGNLGVFPEYRRQGYAQLLIHSLLTEFINYGTEYAQVGTPTHNVTAIEAYAKAGFRFGNRIQYFKKELS